MITLDDIRQPIADRMVEFEEFVRKSFNEKPGTMMAEMIEYILTSRGKALRPIRHLLFTMMLLTSRYSVAVRRR